MTTAIDHWKTIFRHAHLHSVGSPSIKLTESNPSAILREVVIEGIDQPTVVVHLRSRGVVCQDLSEADGVQSRCDYLVIQELPDGIHVVLIEMKSGSVDRQSIERQFKASKCLLRYCEELLREFHGVETKTQHKYIVFHRAPPISKRPTTPPARPESSPNQPEVIAYQGPIRLRRLR
jgi:hypothetical protein